ncbi:MAG: nitrate reductase cytochrome c-type subunit, partial [Polyangiaceae bacterium]|nr:nitrate reductase cytochrome c-type subunit [Polyangiaceae bacterium]
MSERRYAERAGELRAAVDAMGTPPRGLMDFVTVTREEREASLSARLARRAYDGAPPVIPHAVDERGAPACLACHERGMRVDARIAPAMSHEPYTSCLQCHAPLGEGRRADALEPSV